MNWITNFVKPKLRSLIKRNDIPDHLWIKCFECGEMIFHRVLIENFYICQHCGCHLPLPAEERANLIFGENNFELIELPNLPSDPLRFKDQKKYSDRLKQYRNKTKRNDAVILTKGIIGQKPAVLFVMDFAFMGGSMGTVVGQAFAKAVETCIESRAALVAITSSGGARMQESVLSLMQMPKTVAALALLSQHQLPYIVVLSNPTMGGITASFAMLGDITLAEPRALIGFAGPRVIEQTIRQKLPENFQTSEYLVEHGMIDRIVKRTDIKGELEAILNHLL